VLPDKNGEKTYLPIDSKFPIEEYQRLIDSEDKTESEKLLASAIKRQADSISLKYIFPPLTTDFAIMYFPIEGLYAETIKNDTLMAYLHKKRIMACGPTNLGALLNSLQVGFKTVAIEQRSRELWQLLSAFKVEFEKFSLLLEKTGKKLSEAQDAIDLATKRTKTIGRKLSGVKDITDAEADETLIE
jgi:DNA recombination protein RmuC